MPQIGVQILGDSTSLERAFKRSEVAAAEFNGRMNALGQATRGALSGAGVSGKASFLFGSSAFIGAAASIGALTKSAEAASDLNEQISKSNVVFGQSAKIISDWSESTANSIGISRRAALAAAGTFGSIFVNTGRSKQQAAEFSKTLVDLAGDLASFNNASTDDALIALRSGLAGEIEPLRRFQVFLTEASVAQEALKETGKKSVQQLTQGEKIFARYNLILGQTTIQQGDYARTSKGAANEARTLQANIDDLSAELGGTFLPVVAGSLEVLNQFLGGLQRGIVRSRKFRDNLKDSHFADGWNSAMDEAAKHAGGFLDKLVDITLHVDALKGKLGLGGVGLGPPVPPRERSQEGHVGTEAFQIITPQDADKQAAAFVKRFNAHMKGLQLKFDKAQLTKGFADDLAALNEQLASIEAAEKRMGKTFDLEQQRVHVLGQIKTIQDQISGSTLAQQQAQLEKIQKILDGFDLQLSRAQLTKPLSDDLRVLNRELVEVRRLIALNKDNADLKAREVQIESNILDLKKQQTEATKAQFDVARSNAQSLFGTLFSATEEARKTITILGGSKGRQTVLLPGDKRQTPDAKALLGVVTAQVKAFKTVTASIATLQKRGAPESFLKAARSGQIPAETINALAAADQKTLNAIFKNVRLADKLITRAAKAEINAKDVVIKAATVKVGGALHATQDHGPGGASGGLTINGGLHLHGVQNVKQMEAALERQAKKRAGQRRGRTGGKR